MARIRTVKPELWTNERVAACSTTAVLTYVGLFTQADDHGRHRDNAAVIAGVLWPLRAEHTPVHVEDDLTQLAEAGLICRYTGCDGRPYLHIVGWQEHQKIDRPSQSRMPVCTAHHPEGRCGRCKGACTAAHHPRTHDEPSANPRRTLVEDSPSSRRNLDPAPDGPASPSATPAGTPADGDRALVAQPATGECSQGESAGQKRLTKGSVNPRRGFAEPSASGSRILDPGSVPTGREAPDDTRTLVAEYVLRCAQRPPGDVLGHLGRIVKQLLTEGIDPAHVRAGLARYGEIQGHPSRLPSLVNDAMNARPRAGVGTGHRAWTNPQDTASAYGEEL
jgi:hypothetical protein